MTPSTPLTKLWPKVKERCPGMSLQVVTFENTPSAARGLANLGQDMDIVVGIFDDAFLKERGCLGLELSREPLGCAVPVDSELAKRDIVTFDDLHNHSLMLIRRGWNAEIDRVRDEILLHHPQIALVDFPQYRAEVFNRGANEDLDAAVVGQRPPHAQNRPYRLGLSRVLRAASFAATRRPCAGVPRCGVCRARGKASIGNREQMRLCLWGQRE